MQPSQLPSDIHLHILPNTAAGLRGILTRLHYSPPQGHLLFGLRITVNGFLRGFHYNIEPIRGQG